MEQNWFENSFVFCWDGFRTCAKQNVQIERRIGFVGKLLFEVSWFSPAQLFTFPPLYQSGEWLFRRVKHGVSKTPTIGNIEYLDHVFWTLVTVRVTRLKSQLTHFRTPIQQKTLGLGILHLRLEKLSEKCFVALKACFSLFSRLAHYFWKLVFSLLNQ